MSVPPVPLDPEVERMMAAMRAAMPAGAATPTGRDSLQQARTMGDAMTPPVADVIGDRPVVFEDRMIPGREGAPGMGITILRPKESAERAPGLFNVHGGGLISGNRFMDTGRLADLVLEFGFVAVNLDYRLAPENPGSGPAEDSYAGLCWTADNAEELGIDAGKLFVMGGSAGALLSAAMSLMARDRKGPKIAGQVLLAPMLDDRHQTVSSHQVPEISTWTRESSVFAWECVLGDQAGGSDVSPYAAPARATDLSGLPPAFVELGSAELFRDEGVAYASRIWAAGGEAELHVWNGGIHGFDIFTPGSALARDALAARSSWFRRMLAR